MDLKGIYATLFMVLFTTVCNGLLQPEAAYTVAECRAKGLQACNTRGEFGDYFNATCFDPKKEICCGQELWPNLPNTKCCDEASLAYNTSSHFCCGGSVVELSSSKACCDTGFSQNVFDTSTHTCCNGTLQPLTYGRDSTECCGAQIYDKSTKTCCNGFQVMDRATDCSSQSCRLSLCSTKGLKGCLTRVQQGDWFNGNCFDPKTQICCANSLFDKDGDDIECCEGVGTYNKTSHFCCSNQILPKRDNPNMACCHGDGMDSYSGEMYNKMEKICCASGLQSLTYGVGNTGCCGGVTYNMQTSKCCGGQVLGIDIACCGDSVLGSSQICCDNKPTFKRHADDDSCCTGYSIGQVTTYNMKREVCCFGRKYPVGTIVPECPLTITKKVNKLDRKVRSALMNKGNKIRKSKLLHILAPSTKMPPQED